MRCYFSTKLSIIPIVLVHSGIGSKRYYDRPLCSAKRTLLNPQTRNRRNTLLFPGVSRSVSNSLRTWVVLHIGFPAFHSYWFVYQCSRRVEAVILHGKWVLLRPWYGTLFLKRPGSQVWSRDCVRSCCYVQCHRSGNHPRQRLKQFFGGEGFDYSVLRFPLFGSSFHSHCLCGAR